jgi:hypothetical protein
MDNSQPVLWFVHQVLPVGMQLRGLTPEGTHPLTPVEIRDRYHREVHRSALVTWFLPAQNLFGMKAGAPELTWKIDTIREFQLFFQLPAKGLGDLGIYVIENLPDRTTLSLHAHGYKASSLDWLKNFFRHLEKHFPNQTQIVDDGYDV